MRSVISTQNSREQDERKTREEEGGDKQAVETLEVQVGDT